MSRFFGPITDPGLYFNGETEEAVPRNIDAISTGDFVADLPVSGTCVVVGEVTSAEAFLSRDRNWVYSDFGVKVESVLKQDSAHPVQEGATLVTYRNGGALRFPSGHIRHYIIMNHGFPGVGDRYLLFLSRDSHQAGRYFIDRGYQLKDGLVYPLDVDHLVNAQPYSQYEGMKEEIFLEKVLSALNTKPPKRGGR
jgi:hypothetical protein